MQCERCGVALEVSQVYNFQGKVLCEDCCFDLMNPPKACDALAIVSNLSIRKQLGQTGTDGLTDLQKQLYELVIERSKVSQEEAISLFKLTPQELERQFVILRHCELLRLSKEGSTIYFVKY